MTTALEMWDVIEEQRVEIMYLQAKRRLLERSNKILRNKLDTPDEVTG